MQSCYFLLAGSHCTKTVLRFHHNTVRTEPSLSAAAAWGWFSASRTAAAARFWFKKVATQPRERPQRSFFFKIFHNRLECSSIVAWLVCDPCREHVLISISPRSTKSCASWSLLEKDERKSEQNPSAFSTATKVPNFQMRDWLQFPSSDAFQLVLGNQTDPFSSVTVMTRCIWEFLVPWKRRIFTIFFHRLSWKGTNFGYPFFFTTALKRNEA